MNYYAVELKDIFPELKNLVNVDMSQFKEGLEIDMRLNRPG